jgi:hypothetical protein
MPPPTDSDLLPSALEISPAAKSLLAPLLLLLLMAPTAVTLPATVALTLRLLLLMILRLFLSVLPAAKIREYTRTGSSKWSS